VTFDIDANGIVHVSAKDLGTGKEQSIQIVASSGLKESEIQQMVKDAEAHAAEDKERREMVEARNHLDTLIYSSERSLGELKDKLPAEEQGRLNSALEEAKKALDSKDKATIEAAAEKLTQASHKLSEEMYKRASAQHASAAGGGNGASKEGSAESKADDNVVDADFEEVGKK